METPLTLKNACVVRELLIFLFSQNFILEVRVLMLLYRQKYSGVASNDAPYER